MSEAPRLSSLKYQVTSVLASEGGTTVLQVADRSLGGGTYALKVVHREGPDDDPAIDRMRAECEASAKLHHPSVLASYDFRLRRSWFRVDRAELLMEYVEGKPLSSLAELPVAAATMIFLRAASALAHMHRRGVLHGGLRPSKVLLSRAGQVKIRGYGLPLVRAEFKGRIKAERDYAAPERLKKGVVDDLGDIYGLGATMYQTFTGQPPVNQQGPSEERKITKPAALNPEIPAPVNELLMACLQSHPERRPPDMYEIVKQLETLAKTMSIGEAELAGLTVEEES